MIGQSVGSYEILEKIGEGGMGVVYRARDLRLDRFVALKFLSRELISNDELKHRFIQEAKAASALDHPNICTIHTIDETDDGQLFIAMAYYEGETVKARMRRGLMSSQEIVDIATQVAAGLAAAHERGIVHLDVKPANLMVTREGTVKILDFGLSRFTSQVSERGASGPLMGTVAYLSPERVKGETAGPESDIWSLGVVLYEMATGTRPFHGGSDMSVLYAVVHREFTPPIVKIQDLSPELDRVIRRALVKDRRYRYRSLPDLMTDLEALHASRGLTSTLPWVYHRPWRYGSRPQRVAAGLVVLVLGLSILQGVLWALFDVPFPWSSRPGPLLAGDEQILLAGLLNLTGSAEDDWLGESLGELLAFELQGRLELGWARTSGDGSSPPAIALQDFAGHFGPEEGFNDHALERIWKTSASRFVLSGAYRKSAEELQITLRLQATQGKEWNRSFEAAGSEKEILILATSLAQSLIRDLELQIPEYRSQEPPEPPDPEVAKLLDEARRKMRLSENRRARDLLLQGLEIAPEDFELLTSSAQAHILLGRFEEAGEAALRAVVAARRHPLEAHLLARALSFEANALGQRAAALRRALWITQEPGPDGTDDYVDHGIYLVNLLLLLGHDGAAQEMLTALEALTPEDPRTAIAKARGLEVVSRQEQQAAAAHAIALALEMDAPLLLAEALLREAEAYHWLGETERAIEDLRSAREIYAREGELRGEGMVLTELGGVMWSRRDFANAKTFFEQAARLFQTLGDRRMRGRMLINLALVLRERGDYGAATEVYRQAIEELEQVNDLIGVVHSQLSVAEVLWVLGRFDETEVTYQRAFASLRTINNPSLESWGRSHYAEFLLYRGEFEAAARQLERALALQAQLGDRLEEATTLIIVGDQAYFQGDLEAAARRYRQALTIFEETDDLALAYSRAESGLGSTLTSQGLLGEAHTALNTALKIQDELSDPFWAARTRLALAHMLIQEGRDEEAEVPARQALVDLAQSRAVLEIARAHTFVARSLLAQGDSAGAQSEIDEARQTLGEIPTPAYRLEMELVAARIRIDHGELAEARAALEELLATATAKGLGGLELEIELTLGEIQLRTGSGRSGRTRLLDLAAAAKAKGHNLLARSARELADGKSPD